MKQPIAVLVVALVAVAGCSSSTGSSGAVQNDVVASAASAISSPAASVTPSTAGSAMASPSASTVASPVLTPEGTPNIGATAGVGVCDTGLEYACGDTGPGGGVVYYASATAFACGSNGASMCNFLEVAPNLWDPNSQHNCPGECGGSSQQTSDVSGTGKGITGCTAAGSSGFSGPVDTAIGTGFYNTDDWVDFCNADDAANVARAYTGEGLTDWSLPSEDELEALYSYPNRNAIGGFVDGFYWSSTSEGTGLANAISFGAAAVNGGGTESAALSQTLAVRPVRAF